MNISYFIGLFLLTTSLSAGKVTEDKKKRRAERKAQEIKELEAWGTYFEEHPEEKNTCIIGDFFQGPTSERRKCTLAKSPKRNFKKRIIKDKPSFKAESVHWRTKYPNLPIKKAILKHLQEQEQALNEEISE